MRAAWAGTWRSLAKLTPRRGSNPARSLAISQGVTMEVQLEILDLGDAMVETRCSIVNGPQIDNFYGPAHWSC
jgi:hypothetical protein